MLQSLNLPGSLQALEKPLGLPAGLVAHAQEIRQEDGFNRLHRLMDDVVKLKASDRAMYNEVLALVQFDAAEDDRKRTRYGTERWTRPRSQEAGQKLWAQAEEINGYLKSANSSDELVEGKVKKSESMLRLLAGPDQDLEDFVPSSRRTTIPFKVEREATVLRNCLNEVNKLENSRRRKVNAVREKAASDDISQFSFKILF